MSAVLNAPTAGATPWRHALAALGLLFVAILLLYRDTFAAMYGIWMRSDTFAHAVLVPPIVLWLVWRRREELRRFAPRPQRWMLLPMALVASGWLIGDLAGVNAVTQLCVTALLVLAVPAVLGLAVTRLIAFPLAFLFFMVPIGDFLLPLMMEATADFTVAAVALSGVPVYREGLQFVIPSGAWSVVEACSGVRYLIASFMVGTLFAYLNYSTLWRRLVFCVVALLVPVLANWLRAYMIVMLGHLSGNTIAVGVDHLIYGWVFFGVVILLMFLIGSRWSEPEAAAGVPAPLHAGQIEPAPVATWGVALLAAALVSAPSAAAWQLGHPARESTVSLTLPDFPDAPEAKGQTPLLNPTFPGAAAQATRSYIVDGGLVTVHVAYFRHQGYGAKLASSENALVRSDDKKWNRVASGQSSLALEGRDVPLRTAEMIGVGALHAGNRQRVDVRQVLWVGGRFTINDHWATALGVFSRLAGLGDDGAIVSLYTQDEDKQVTAARLNNFVARRLPAIEARLEAARQVR
ncbi:MAG: exosortase A [Leptothrix sp. (in: Bacteria)]|nr:exosortase A [Leptothrix sp. (in: b-proteobacteria)]